jgi:two-component sensor histidine kinase
MPMPSLPLTSSDAVPPPSRPRRADLPAILALTALYVAAGKLGLSLAFVHTNASAVWPPAGLALAALLVFGMRLWPGVLLGAFITNITTGSTGAGAALAIAVGNSLEAVTAASLIRRWAGGVSAFDTARGVLAFTGIAAATTMISATIGPLSLAVAGRAPWPSLPAIWATWWLGDLSSDLIVAPVATLWLGRPRPARSGRAVAEGVAVAGSTLAVAIVVFGGRLGGRQHYPLAYLSLPLLVWAGLRFGPHGASTVAAILNLIAAAGTVSGSGPFAVLDPNVSLLLVQGFMAVASLTALTLAAVVAEGRRIQDQMTLSLREKEVLLREIHHRVKNNLQVVSSLLSLQADRVPADAEVAHLVAESQSRIRSMALVHESLLQSATMASIEMRPYARRLTEELGASCAPSGRVRIELAADDLRLGIDRAVPCGLILNELITNALKHAFPGDRAGVVRVVVRGDSRRLTLSVEDDGVGLPDGADPAEARTLGLRLVQALAEQLGGTLAVGRGPGTRIELAIRPSDASDVSSGAA